MEKDASNGLFGIVAPPVKYTYNPIYNNQRSIIGWQMENDSPLWMPVKDPPRVIEHYELAKYDATFTSIQTCAGLDREKPVMYIKWPTVPIPQRYQPFPAPWPQHSQPSVPVPFTFNERDSVMKSA
jgi:hypothetical protein